MTIFQLLVYSCVAFNGLDGNLLSKTCRWDVRDLYSSELTCNSDGASWTGRPIFSDVAEDRKVERHKCSPIHVY